MLTHRSQRSEQKLDRSQQHLFHPDDVSVVVFLWLNLIFKCHQYGFGAMFSDWGSDSDVGADSGADSDSDSGKKDLGHNAIPQPKQALDSDLNAHFNRPHNVHPAPIANAPTESTIDPKELENHHDLPPLTEAQVRVIFLSVSLND